jgi:Uma2 family endonuclease
MVATHPLNLPSPPLSNGENRVLLRDIEWSVYQSLLEARKEQRSPRFSYYKGLLEIMAPSEPHENASDLIGDFIKILTEEIGLNLKSMGSTTLNRPDLNIGAEPDKCFYIQNESLVRGKIVDLNLDPPPDLVIEIDITHTDINKNALYEKLKVPEFWRFNGRDLTIYELHEGQYLEVPMSPTFPWIGKDTLYKFLANCRNNGETLAKRTLRQWVREHSK